jgi:PAS domain S-box-containing protein
MREPLTPCLSYEDYVRIIEIMKGVLRSSDIRILAAMLAGIALAGAIDGSYWRSLLSPTLAYRPAILFGLTLLFGWRALVWSHVLFLGAFAAFFGWQAALAITAIYLLSHTIALFTAQRLAGGEPWLSRQKSTLAFLASAALAPFIPALLNDTILHLMGGAARPVLPSAVEAWLRGVAAMVAVAPAILVYGSGRLLQGAEISRDRDGAERITFRNVLELSAEVVMWSLALWITVRFDALYHLNVTYLTFLPPLAFTLFRGMRLATLALAANAVAASTLWLQLKWADTLPAGDLRLLVSVYSATILVLAIVVDERKRNRDQVQRLLLEEAVLRDREAHFRTLANSAPVMIWLTDPDKQSAFVNQGWLDFTGAKIEDFRGAGWANFLHPDDLLTYTIAFESAFDARRSFGMECRVRRADGKYRWLFANGAPLYRDGRFAGFIGCSVDITGQRLATERLKESQAKLSYVQRMAKMGSFEFDLEQDDAQFSEEMLRILGSTVPPPNLAACLKYVHPNDLKRVEEALAHTFSSSAPVEVEHRIVRANGEQRALRSIIAGINGPRGMLGRVMGATQDITDQVLARERLQESEQRLKSAQDLAHVGSWHWDLETDQISCSDECLRIFGQAQDYKPSLKALLELIAPHDKKRVTNEIGSGLKEARGISTEFQIIRPDGEMRTVTFASRVLLNGEGAPRHVFGACQDVTDARREQETAFARQKLETLGAIANGIAHDFNNLLGGVLAQAELALDELDSGSAPKRELTSIRQVAMRGSEIVRELMIYAGTDSQNLVPLDLSAAVGEILALLKVSVSKRAVIQTDLAADLPLVRANSGRISQLVMNLVANASEAIGDRDGVIRVVTRRAPRRAAAAAVANAGKYPAALVDAVQLEISDSGRGMPRQMQAKVFEPFFTTKAGGRGLGLAIVDGIVRSLSGSVQLESEPDKGTTIRISLPVAEATQKPSATNGTDKVIAPAPPLTATVLIVEDEEPLRIAVSKMLGKSGFSMIEAANGDAALSVLRAGDREIDLLVLDITIPGASSTDVFQEAARLRPEMPVIVTSAYTQEVSAAVLKTEVKYFLRKPYRVGDLAGLIRQLCSRSR